MFKIATYGVEDWKTNLNQTLTGLGCDYRQLNLMSSISKNKHTNNLIMVSKTFCASNMQVLNGVVQNSKIQLTQKP